MIKVLSHYSVILAMVALATGSLFAEENDWRQPRVIKLRLSPSAPDRAALRYQLQMNSRERVTGNAAPFYYRAILTYRSNSVLKDHEQTLVKFEQEWNERPCVGETREQMRAWVDQFPPLAVAHLREATRRDHCDFDLRVRHLPVKEMISLTLPEFQDLRMLARYLAHRAQVEIADGKFDEARETIRMSYQLGRDANSEPLLICSLIGVAVTSLTNSHVERWIEAPNSPNLYWPLTALPQPPIDMRTALEHEVGLSERMFPFIKDAETANRTPEQWRQLMSDALVDINAALANDAKPDAHLDPTQRDLAVTLKMAEAYPIAKEWLLKDGFDPPRLEAMPVCQVVAVHSRRVLREMADEMLKGANLPPPQRNQHYSRIDQRISQESIFGSRWYEPVPIGRYLMPSIGQALLAQARLEEANAGLRTLEAIRAHLAETGKLPEKLDDIKVVPVPVSPATNLPFAYQLTETGATLIVPSVRPNDLPQNTKHYELSVAK